MYQDATLFFWNENLLWQDAEGICHHLYQIDFHANKNGLLVFKFPNGHEETVFCYSTTNTNMNANKKRKLSSNDILMEDESQSAEHYSELSSPITFNNTNQFPMQVQTPPQILQNGTQVASNRALIVNILLLVPDNDEFIKLTEDALLELGFSKEVSCLAKQRLYSQKNMLKKIRHVLIFPFGRMARAFKVQDYLDYSSEVILLVENTAEQANDLMTINRVNNINNQANEFRQFWVKNGLRDFGTIDLDYPTLNSCVKFFLTMKALDDVVLGGASCKPNTYPPNFLEFLLQWNSENADKAVQNIYLCFKFEQDNEAFTEDAAIALKTFGIDFNVAVGVNGSVLVYTRCPSYTIWYILHRKDDLFNEFKNDGLIEVFECFISDIEESMQRSDNAQFMEELSYMKELMIIDGVPEQPILNR